MTPTKQPEVWAIARLREALATEPGGPEITITKAVAVALLDLRATPPQVAEPVAWMVTHASGDPVVLGGRLLVLRSPYERELLPGERLVALVRTSQVAEADEGVKP